MRPRGQSYSLWRTPRVQGEELLREERHRRRGRHFPLQLGPPESKWTAETHGRGPSHPLSRTHLPDKDGDTRGTEVLYRDRHPLETEDNPPNLSAPTRPLLFYLSPTDPKERSGLGPPEGLEEGNIPVRRDPTLERRHVGVGGGGESPGPR